ncbi:alpha/beta hydrolase family protein [Thalassotalea ganghwensis]
MKRLLNCIIAASIALTSLVYAKDNSIATAIDAIEGVTKVTSCFADGENGYHTFIQNNLAQFKRNYKRHMANLTYEKLASGFPEQKYQQLKDNMQCWLVNYLSDGIEVEGFLLAAKKLSHQQPLVVFNRGGNGNFGKQTPMQILKQLPLVKQGAIVIGSQYREQDEFGGKDLNDVHNLIDIAKQLPQVQPGKINMVGVSRGGMTSYMVAKERSDINKLVIWAGNSDLAKALEYRPEMERVYQYRIPNYSKNKALEIEKRSAINWVEKLDQNISILLLHGDADKRVDVSQAEIMADKLTQLNRPHKLVIYPNGSHNLKRYNKEVYQEIGNWFAE